MKKNYFFSAVLAIAATVACTEKGPVDFPIQGDLTLYGENVAGQEVGVFVTSDGLPQSNLLYTAAEGEGDGAVALTAKAEKAGFKQGNHVVYAYAPYAETAAELTAVPMPDYSVQETAEYDPYAGTDYAGMMISYNSTAKPFYSAVLEVKEYSSAAYTLPFTEAVSLTEVSVMEFSLSGDNANSKIDKKVNKIVVTADTPIAIKNASYDFVERKINKEDSKSIELKVDYAIYKSYFVSGNGFSFKTSADLNGKTVKIEAYLEDGSVFAGEATVSPGYLDPNSLMVSGLDLAEVK